MTLVTTLQVQAGLSKNKNPLAGKTNGYWCVNKTANQNALTS